jgi:hypothetical protein
LYEHADWLDTDHLTVPAETLETFLGDVVGLASLATLLRPGEVEDWDEEEGVAVTR